VRFRPPKARGPRAPFSAIAVWVHVSLDPAETGATPDAWLDEDLIFSGRASPLEQARGLNDDTKRLIVIAIVLALGVAAYMWASSRPQPLVASGTVEARDIRVGSKVGGRIEQVLVREGDKVEAGKC